MINGKSVLAVIPARGGSKGLPKKNILPLVDKPLIAWSIEVGKESKYIDKLIISTDDKKIVDVAESYRCEVPFIRPEKLSSDEAATIDVLIHAFKYFTENNEVYDYLILLEPTSPLRDSNDIDIAMDMLDSNRERADSIVGVAKVEATHPVFDVRINDGGLIEPYATENFSTFRRQEIEDLYHFEGSLYISDTKVLLKEKTFYHERTLPYIVPRWKSLEIDEMVDMITAEALINNKSLLNTDDLNG